MHEEKRKAIRVSKPLSVQFGVKTGEMFRWDMSLIKDISERGICLRTAFPLKKDDICYLRVRMPTNPGGTVEISAKVVEAVELRNGMNSTHLEFLDLDEEQKRLLREYVAWVLVNERGGK